MSNATIYPSVAPTTIRTPLYVRLGFTILALIFTSLGNALVITIIVRKQDRNINDRFISNLAIADVLFIVFSLPGVVFKAFGIAHHSQFVCSFVRPQVTMFFCLGLFTITSMALYRCKVMLNPYQAKMRSTYAYLWIVLLWLLAFLTSLPAVIVGRVSPKGKCYGKWRSKAYKDAYIIFLLIAKCILPLILITFSYIRIGFFLHKNRVPAANAKTRSGMNYRNRVENIKVAKTVAAIIVMFTISTAPFQIAWIMQQFGGPDEEKMAIEIFRVSVILQNLHTCINPLIYVISRKYFRQEFIKYLKRLFCCCCGQIVKRKIHPSRSENNHCDDITHQGQSSAHACGAIPGDGHVTRFAVEEIEGLEATTERTQSFFLSPLFSRKSSRSPENHHEEKNEGES